MEIPYDKSDFKLKFDGELHQIDANLLISSLVHMSAIIQEVNRELRNEKNIEIKIKALDKGSFLVHLELIESITEQLAGLFTRENAETASHVVAVLIGLFGLKKVLKGKKASKVEEKEKDKVEIENEKGDRIVVENITYNIYSNNSIVNNAITQNFEALKKDESVTNFQITDDEENPLVKIEKEEFEDLSHVNEEIIDETSRAVTEVTILNIVRLAFNEKYKWEFYYKGNKISAKIIDEGFNQKVDEGESFAKGDSLEVEMTINQEFDPSVNTYINKSYQITKVIDHHPRGNQQNMFS